MRIASFIARCVECRHVYATPFDLGDPPPHYRIPTCGAKGPVGSGYTCPGALALAPAELQAAWQIGGAEAVLTMLDHDPSLGWYVHRTGERLLMLVA